jgi:hypothetical protein
MTSSVVSKISINAKPPQIFKYLRDTNYHLLWNPHLQSLTPMKRLQEGDSYTTSSLLLGVKVNGKIRVTKLKPNIEMQVENNTGTLTYKVNYKLQSNSLPTVLVCTTEVSASGPSFAFTAPILKMLARRELQSDLKALKLAVEQELG